MIFLLKPFFYSCILCLCSQQFYGLLFINFPWYFPEKSGNICLFFRHVWFNIQWNFVYFSPFELVFELSFFIHPLIYSFIYSLIYSFIYSYISLFEFSFAHLFISHLSYLFELFSISIYLFISCSLFFVKLC